MNPEKPLPLASASNPLYERIHTALHVLWSKAVGQPGYVKSEWAELEQAIQSLAQEADSRLRETVK
jgi:hypothetical protein